jgi:hypothetical protein
VQARAVYAGEFGTALIALEGFYGGRGMILSGISCGSCHDTALSPIPYSLTALLAFAEPGTLAFGSTFTAHGGGNPLTFAMLMRDNPDGSTSAARMSHSITYNPKLTIRHTYE